MECYTRTKTYTFTDATSISIKGCVCPYIRPFEPLAVGLGSLAVELGPVTVGLGLLADELGPLADGLGPLAVELKSLAVGLGPLAVELGPLAVELGPQAVGLELKNASKNMVTIIQKQLRRRVDGLYLSIASLSRI